jgi:helicase MOV-10
MTAADVLCSRLAAFFGPDELFRLNWWQRPMAAVPLHLLTYSRFDHLSESSRFDLPLDQLQQFKIIVCTSVAAGVMDAQAQYQHPGSPLSLQFDLVVLDEVSQATEGESLVPVSLVKPSGVIVLSGDPEQLGPVPRSPIFRAADMHQSLQERLLQHDIYENIRPYFGDEHENSDNTQTESLCKFGVYLRHNYRSQVSFIALYFMLFPLFSSSPHWIEFL